MFAVVVVLHWSIQRLLGLKVEDATDAAPEYRNNSADNSRKQEEVTEEVTDKVIQRLQGLKLLDETDAVAEYRNNSANNSRIQEEVTEEFQATIASSSTSAPTSVPILRQEEFPFLSDRDTISFLKRSHVIFIMRGLPGSGKSTLVRQLQQTYPGAVVCSADHFFTDSEGKYNFDASKLSQAHEQCQQRATDACHGDHRAIIIDNTNVQAWTMTHYLGLAQYRHFYHCLIVEPNTPWRYDPEELARRNTHNVERSHIASKVKLIRDKKFLPSFYGWFLRQEDSAQVLASCFDVWKLCSDALPNGVVVDGDTCQPPRKFMFLLDHMYSTPHKMLHCTARFLGSNTKDLYHQNELVKHAMGRKFSIKIIGFAFSERNVSALVDLYCDSQSTSDHNNLLDLFVKPEENSYREKHHDDVSRTDSDNFFRHGYSAHMTITFRNGGQAKHSGDDILEMREKDYFGQFCSMDMEFGTVTAYRGNMYKVILNEPVVMDCLYQGIYSMRGHR